MRTPLFLRPQLNTLIAGGNLAAVAAIVDECRQAGCVLLVALVAASFPELW